MYTYMTNHLISRNNSGILATIPRNYAGIFTTINYIVPRNCARMLFTEYKLLPRSRAGANGPAGQVLA